MSTSSSPSAAPQQSPPSQPWWKYGHVWLIIAGPAIVVVAGFFTLWLAVHDPDPVIAEDYYQRGLDINKTLNSDNPQASMQPAVKGRNHAATPDRDQPR
ncbi:FixH family protein [Pulveribacter suum]|uniref:Nitrogen fixation protein FixH n=1 Tax=Pulveribacter suum TaxID=2116657 RepID=A0A2P1NK60_9BURK|nr:FixH family protein [Pulveribacter suum]AVP57425.1 nitrogen fixation protein FixH [Pulveribacter suum]